MERYENEEYLIESDSEGADGNCSYQISGDLPHEFVSLSETYSDQHSLPDVDQDPEENVDRTDKLYSFEAIFFRRLYCNQLKPRECSKKVISGDTIDEILKAIWQIAKNQIHRQVVFENGEPVWSSLDHPAIENLDDFVTVQDKTKKKNYTISNIKSGLLTKWRNKTLNVYIHVYSRNVTTAAQHQNVVRKLVAPKNPDRSGAASNRDDATLANELKNTHPHLDGHHSSWLLWANFIHSSSPHTHQQLKEEVKPPLELAKYFRWTAVSEVKTVFRLCNRSAPTRSIEEILPEKELHQNWIFKLFEQDFRRVSGNQFSPTERQPNTSARAIDFRNDARVHQAAIFITYGGLGAAYSQISVSVARMQSVNRGMQVANTVNNNWMKEILEIKRQITLVKATINSIEQQVDALVARGSMESEIFEAMESATRPEETELSRTLADRVNDMRDIDHE
ncbi:uncharacterized protein LOC129741540 [Uranotaenia lowii]|uniref:uncharacterized protein LOC129741540 n=1 Tax=Uranotaenia lowii TaxID=190385 RepID=UPI00247A9C84|nr:uncharacterized protein LOC129741540 [Uranotaenia lowii]